MTTAPAPAAPIPARRPARLLGRPAFWVAAVAVLFGVPLGRALLRNVPPPPPVLGTLPAFTLTDQTNHPYGTADLQGKVWVADFIFTSCQAACPLLSQQMSTLMQRTRHLGPDFRLVSLTVDPERDTPEKLAEYAGRFGGVPHKWAFLTGPVAAIEAAVVDGFKEGMGKTRVPAGAVGADAGAASDSFWEIFHGEHLVLVDRQLRIRGYFQASGDGLDHLVEAIGQVANEP